MTRIGMWVVAVLCTACAPAVWSPGGDVTVGNGRTAQLAPRVAGASTLDVENWRWLPMTVDVVVGGAPALRIEADENLLPFIKYAESGGTLKVWTTGNLRSAHPVRIHYTTAHIARVASRGNADLTLTHLDEADLTVDTQGSGSIDLAGSVQRLALASSGHADIRGAALVCASAELSVHGSGSVAVGRVDGARLRISASGSPTIAVGGTVGELRADTAGSVTLALARLVAREARLDVDGAGSAAINVTERVAVDSRGAADIVVDGHPRQRAITGARVKVL